MDSAERWIERTIVYDQLQPCPYLHSQMARMPMLFGPPLTGAELDAMLAAGFRRTGILTYYTACPRCQACEPTRVDATDFPITPSLRRVLQRGDRHLTVRLGPCNVDRQRMDLYDRHRRTRGLEVDGNPIHADEYQRAFVDSCCETAELSCWIDDRLVAVSVTDLGQQSMSAVYCYFDPDLPRLSLGTYCILKQMEWARQTGRRYLYLGMYIEANQHVRYKARFVPQERLIKGRWTRFEVANQWADRLDNHGHS